MRHTTHFLVTFLVFPVFAPAQQNVEPCVYFVTDERAVAADAVGFGGGRMLCAWAAADESGAAGRVIRGAYYGPDYGAWYGPNPLVTAPSPVADVRLLWRGNAGELWLFTVEGAGDTWKVVARSSADGGSRWSEARAIHEAAGRIRLGAALTTDGGAMALGFVEEIPAGRGRLVVALSPDGGTWTAHRLETAGDAALAAPAMMARNGGFDVYFVSPEARRHFRVTLHLEKGFGKPEAVNLPYAHSESPRAAAMLGLADERLAAVGAVNVLKPSALAVCYSYDGGRTWPVRRTLADTDNRAPLALAQTQDGALHVIMLGHGGVKDLRIPQEWALEPTRLSKAPRLASVVPPLDSGEHLSTPRRAAKTSLPVADEPFIEHVRVTGAQAEPADPSLPEPPRELPGAPAAITTPVVIQGGMAWVGAADGLYSRGEQSKEAFQRYPEYGAGGPPSNLIAGLAVDSKGTLWVATAAGLAARDSGGAWRTIRGREGLPYEELTCIAIDGQDRIWLGSARGLILYRPYAQGRQWFYRVGERYLPADHVTGLKLGADGRSVFARTDKGWGRIDEESVTLHGKAEYLEARFNERHRRLGMASLAQYDDAYAMTNWTHGPQPSDGLWTSYHIAAMSMAYSLTGEERYRESAKSGMEALYLLQNVTGIEGLVARTVIAADEPYAEQARKQSNWHETADGRYLWRDDVSSDQIDGHYFAFYTYFEHIAQFDPAERERLEKQLRQVTDYILNNNYQIPDWDGERTLWGWWNPELLNDEPIHYLESGLYSLMILSFLKTAYYVTEDEKYLEHFRTLIEEHGYLSNLLLEKKLFPDELNHSDDQLSAVAFYPILQLEYDPFIRDALRRTVRRHAYIEQPERNSLFAFTYASVDPADADVAGGVQTLREMPRDRRNWRQDNSHRADVLIDPRVARGGQRILIEVLPADERYFERWNQDPYEADTGGDGRTEGSGEHYLLPYWMGRYHGLLAAPGEE